MNYPLRSAWIVGILLMSLISVPLTAEDVVYEKNLYMWDGKDGRVLIMVPPSKLRSALFQIDGASPETIGIPKKDWSVFIEQLNYPQGERQQCSTSTDINMDGFPDPTKPSVRSPPGSRTALGPIRARSTAMVGRVEAKVASWNFHSSVNSLVFLRIEEILKDDSNALAVGDLFTITLPWGELEIGERRLCKYEPSGVLDFEVGDQFIVTGRVDPWNDDHIETSDSFYYKIVNGAVTYSPRRTSFKADSNLTLSRIREELQSDISH